jgi:hypothetical protein
MRMSLLYTLAAVLVVGLISPKTSRADSLLIGQISFDSGVSPDGSTFDLDNFTDGLIDPDGIADSELFSGALTVVSSGGTKVYAFSDIDFNGGTLATIAPGTDIVSATLALSLSNSTGVNIFDDGGNSAVANLQGVSNTDLPLVNLSQALTSCDGSGSPCSQAVIYVDTAPSGGVVPEPATLWLMLTGFSGAAALRRRLCR